MDTPSAILTVVIVLLMAERVWEKYHTLKQFDQMNRALLSKSVPEYSYDNKAEIKKLETENDLALNAARVLEEQEHGPDAGKHYPIT